MADQPPHTVKDLLVELKDASELMVDLAYAAVFFNDDKIADEVIRLDGRSGDLLRRLRTMAMLAARMVACHPARHRLKDGRREREPFLPHVGVSTRQRLTCPVVVDRRAIAPELVARHAPVARPGVQPARGDLGVQRGRRARQRVQDAVRAGLVRRLVGREAPVGARQADPRVARALVGRVDRQLGDRLQLAFSLRVWEGEGKWAEL